MLKRVLTFIRENRLYLLIGIFLLLLNFLIITSENAYKAKAGVKGSIADSREAKKAVPYSQEEQARYEKLLIENKPLAVVVGLVSLLIILLFLLGAIIDASLVSRRISKGPFNIKTQELGQAAWGMTDVFRVVTLFLFFGYMLVMIESFLVSSFHFLRNDNLRMVINSTILDVVAIFFVLYFVVGLRKEPFSSLGLTLKNFRGNVIYGVIGYLAIIPVLIGILAIIGMIVQATNYVPERQAVVNLFLKESDERFLFFTALFAGIAGPFVEEVFFRGFLYKACRKITGAFWAIVLTSALFAMLHTNVIGFLPIMVLGVLLAYLYEKTGSLVSSITVHMIHNVSMVCFVFLVKKIQG